MLVVTRKRNEAVVVGRAGSRDAVVTVKVLEIRGGTVRLGFSGDVDVPIHRSEVWERIRTNGPPDTPELPQSRTA